MNRKLKVILIVVAGLIQLAVVGTLIGRWEATLRGGAEIRVPTGGFDPVNPFVGRYVRIRSRLTSTNCVDGVEYWRLHRFWFAVRPNAESGLAEVVAVGKTRDELPEDAIALQLRGHTMPSETWAVLPDRYYMSERTVGAAEELVRSVSSNECVAVYRVNADGGVLLADVEIRGKPLKDCVREAASDGK